MGILFLVLLAGAPPTATQTCSVRGVPVSIVTRRDPPPDALAVAFERIDVRTPKAPLFRVRRVWASAARVNPCAPDPHEPLKPMRFECVAGGVKVTAPGGAAVVVELPRKAGESPHVAAGLLAELSELSRNSASEAGLARATSLRTTLQYLEPIELDADEPWMEEVSKAARLAEATQLLALGRWRSARDRIAAGLNPDDEARLQARLSEAQGESVPLRLAAAKQVAFPPDFKLRLFTRFLWKGPGVCLRTLEKNVTTDTCLDPSTGVWARTDEVLRDESARVDGTDPCDPVLVIGAGSPSRRLGLAYGELIDLSNREHFWPVWASGFKASVSPDGRWLAFLSAKGLALIENLDVTDAGAP